MFEDVTELSYCLAYPCLLRCRSSKPDKTFAELTFLPLKHACFNSLLSVAWTQLNDNLFYIFSPFSPPPRKAQLLNLLKNQLISSQSQTSLPEGNVKHERWSPLYPLKHLCCRLHECIHFFK